VPWIQEVVGRLERAAFEADLTHLATLPSRHSTLPGYGAATDWARSRLTDLGYATSTEPITVGGKESLNVVAERPGGGPAPQQLILVTAHLDSINLAGGSAAPAPGADDNASGSAGVVEMARVFCEHAGRHDLRFVLFGGEEQGLFGSTQHVAGLAPAERARIAAVVNMDMIGSLNTSTPSVLLEGAPVSQALIEALATAAAAHTNLTVETSLHPFASDHVPFINANLSAVLTIEGADQTNRRIHSAADTVDTLNPDFALEVLRMNVAAVAGLVGQGT
jgi:Zn-dependent M28 family amino/carboxypeptidase